MTSPLARRLVRTLWRLWVYKPTTEGKVLAGCLAVAGSVAMGSLEIPAYHLLCALGGLGLVAFAAGWVLRKRVEVAGGFPETAVAGHPVYGAFTLTNRSRRTAHDLSVGVFDLAPSLEAEAAEAVTALEPDASAMVSLPLKPLKRGIYPLAAVRAFSTFPLGLFRSTLKRPAGSEAPRGGSLLVYPHFHPVTDIDLPVSARYQPGGIALSSNVGESMEYIGNREYRPGDPTRQIDHRSWARLARPVIKEFQEEYYCRIALVLDSFVPGRKKAPPGGFANLEAAVSLAASVADVLARGEYIIDIFAAGPELYVFRAGRHTAHFDNVLEILACVDACRESPFKVVTPALVEELANISTVIGVFLDWDAERERLMRAATEAGCSAKVLIVRDGATSAPYARHQAAWAMSQYTPEQVRHGGIEAL